MIVKSGTMTAESGTMIVKSGTMNGESGTMILEKAKLYDIQSQDDAVFAVVADSPGIKLEAIFLKIKTSTRSVRRTLERLSSNNKIKYRGSKRTGQFMSQIVSNYP